MVNSDIPNAPLPIWRRKFDLARSSLAAFNALGYAEGNWTPTLTFVTPGDLTVVYAANSQLGTYTKIGRIVIATFNITTSTFTHTTASGNCLITGLPFTSASATGRTFGGSLVSWQGITKAGFTQIEPRMGANQTQIALIAMASGVSAATVAAADMPTGGAVSLRGNILFESS